ncbi:FMN-binding protein [Desulfitobacterium dehalogenans ATCC 51507]|uniref:FMN-binding protein n=1 Tax=Desulfitobacterium dehalogenans (strain ATCC 51507 / DSM 9161 / JW/IU-DC1) TaxID=756499 RepID=I4A8I5_DESDJ|nr:4Fe-4S binding protein [Desulfitobacterium dehalogenans]AFM00270.1 FMN-binding protein [Desulfitobacterium dehalogenans ATCC 51507]
MKQTHFSPRSLALITAFVLILAALIFQQSANKQETFTSLQRLEPAVSRYEPIAGGYPTYSLWDTDDHFLGYAVEADASGYGGPLSVFVSLGKDGILKNVIITENCETPAYLSRVLREGYLHQFTGKEARDPFELGHDLDGISGATYTVNGIALAVRKGAWQAGKNELGLQVPAGSQLALGWPELGLILLYGLVFIAVSRRGQKLRPWLLAGSVLFLGFFLNASLSLANLTSLLSGNWPSPLERPFWYILTLGIPILTLLWGRNFYCSWLCPFGGLQEGLYKFLGFIKFNPAPPVLALAHKIRWGVVWAAVMAALIFNNPSIANYEPFAVSFGGQGNLGHWLTLCLVLLTGILFYRVWCRLACPVGAVLNFLASVKRKFKRFFHPHSSADQHADPTFEPPSAHTKAGCSECTAGQDPIRWAGLPGKEKAFFVMLLVYGLLIAITLSLNIPQLWKL